MKNRYDISPDGDFRINLSPLTLWVTRQWLFYRVMRQ